jgi:cytidine deaminase
LPGSERPAGGNRRSGRDRRTAVDRRLTSRRTGLDRRSDAGWEPVALDAAAAASVDEPALVAAAIDARSRARAHYSGFQVGAALETDAGEVVTGCNVENATYGLTVCAERIALFKALSDGHRRFRRVVVVAGTENPTPPCGACRQLLWEFCGDVEVVLANETAVAARHRLAALFPHPFDARLLHD